MNNDNLSEILEELGAIFPNSKRSDLRASSVHLHGVKISAQDYLNAKYDPISEKYFWTDKEGNLHSPRDTVPAEIYPDGTVCFWRHGKLHAHPGPAIKNIFKAGEEKYYVGGVHLDPKKFANQNNHIIMKDEDLLAQPLFEEELIKDKETLKSEKEEKEMPVRKYNSVSVGQPTRMDLFKAGLSRGTKKGLINGGSKLLADQALEFSSFENTEWTRKFTQLLLLVMAAETCALLPNGLFEKIGVSEDSKEGAAEFLREVAGEKIGRDLVDVTAGLLPYFKDVFDAFTVEEIEEATETFSAGGVESSSSDELAELENLAALDNKLEIEEHEEVAA